MSAVRLGNGSTIYRCANASVSRCYHGVSVKVLDEAAWEKVASVFTDSEVIWKELLRLQGDDPTKADLAAVDRELAKIVRQQMNLLDQLADQGSAVAPLVNQKLSVLEANRRQLEADRSRMLEQRQTWQSAMEWLHELQDWCSKVAENLADFSYQQKRTALDALGVQARVWRADHEPERWEIIADIPLDGSFVSPIPARWAR